MTISGNTYEVAENANSILKSELTSSMSPEEVIESLKRVGVDSHVTEKGDLMIRYWRIGAENFVSPEKAAIIRFGQSSSDKGDMIEWLSNNLQNIRKEHGGQWIAINKDEIIASSLNLSELMSQITGYDKPLVTFIPAEPVIWNFIYAF